MKYLKLFENFNKGDELYDKLVEFLLKIRPVLQNPEKYKDDEDLYYAANYFFGEKMKIKQFMGSTGTYKAFEPALNKFIKSNNNKDAELVSMCICYGLTGDKLEGFIRRLNMLLEDYLDMKPVNIKSDNENGKHMVDFVDSNKIHSGYNVIVVDGNEYRTPNGYPSMVNNGVAYTMINGKKVKVIPIKKL